jgi:hypothetical protein
MASQQPYIQICMDLPVSEYIHLDLGLKIWGRGIIQHLLMAPQEKWHNFNSTSRVGKVRPVLKS